MLRKTREKGKRADEVYDAKVNYDIRVQQLLLIRLF